MKVMSIYDEPKLKRIPKRGPLFGAKSFLAMAVLACGVGLYTAWAWQRVKPSKPTTCRSSRSKRIRPSGT